ncbi:MAG: UbiA family prenyltransferase [Bacteroidia bacterium]
MFNRQQKHILLKLIALLGIVRWYNILFITIGLYLTSFTLLGNYVSIKAFLLDFNLHFLVISIACVSMGGYIINAYYDYEKDLINKPTETIVHRVISKEFRLRTALFLTLIGMLIALLCGFIIFGFTATLAFMLWFYSHKLRKKKYLSEISAAFLTVSPFFGLVLYFQHITIISILYMGYLFALSFTREITKKLTTIKGDAVYGDQSLPIVIGVRYTRAIIFSMIVFTILPIVFLFPLYRTDSIAVYYFASVCALLGINLLGVVFSKKESTYVLINNIFKLLIASAVLAILLMKY